MKWRKLFRVLHRDIGYAAAALTIAYAISGVAVNHIQDWNPNYTFEEQAVNLGPLPEVPYGEMERFVVEALDIDPATVKGHFMESATEFRVFLAEGQEVAVDVRDGRGLYKRVKTRAVLYELNVLHLNHIKGLWTWIADLFAVALLVLAVTGIVMMKGPRGITGRGKWFVGAGLIIPIAFIWYMYAGG